MVIWSSSSHLLIWSSFHLVIWSSDKCAIWSSDHLVIGQTWSPICRLLPFSPFSRQMEPHTLDLRKQIHHYFLPHRGKHWLPPGDRSSPPTSIYSRDNGHVRIARAWGGVRVRWSGWENSKCAGRCRFPRANNHTITIDTWIGGSFLAVSLGLCSCPTDNNLATGDAEPLNRSSCCPS